MYVHYKPWLFRETTTQSPTECSYDKYWMREILSNTVSPLLKECYLLLGDLFGSIKYLFSPMCGMILIS